LGCAGAGGDVQALLDKSGELLFAHPLTPARHRRTVEDKRVLKELLAAEQLIIGVFKPAIAQRLVREVVHMLEDRQTRHQPRRQRRMARSLGIDRAEPLLQKTPVARESLASGWFRSTI
jgi:hypothetical protein